MERAQLSVEWLQSARLDRNWTQEYVAERVGVEVMTIRRWEHGHNKPQTRQYYQLCKLFQRELPPGLQGEQDAEVPMPARDERQLSQADEAADACTRFQASDLTVRLLRILWTWPIGNGNARYHKLQTLIMQEVEREDNTMMKEKPINRRNALRRIAVLPIEVYGLSLVAVTPLRSPEELLAQCAAGITACWYLRMGKDLAFAYDVVARYIPALQEIATSGTVIQRKDAAELLVQCFLLKSTLAWHVNTSNAIMYAQSAEKYALVSQSELLQVVALRTQAAALCYADSWEQALYTAEKARYVLETEHSSHIPHIVYSYVYAGLATYQSYAGQKDDALTSLKKARTTFFAPQTSDEDPPIWIDHSIGNLLTNDGLTYYHLGLHQEAVNSFAQIHKHYENDSTIPVSCSIGALINQVMAEVDRDDQPRDMEQCIALWTQGIEGAKTLQSNQCFNKAITTYTAMRAAWPGEQRVKQLREQIQHW